MPEKTYTISELRDELKGFVEHEKVADEAEAMKIIILFTHYLLTKYYDANKPH